MDVFARMVQRGPFNLFAGAGISKVPPSSAPLWLAICNDFLDAVLGAMIAQGWSLPPPLELPGVHNLKVDGTRVRLQVDTDKLDAVLRRLTAVGVRSLVSQPPTLEELFLRHYQAEQVATPAGDGQPTRKGARR